MTEETAKRLINESVGIAKTFMDLPDSISFQIIDYDVRIFGNQLTSFLFQGIGRPILGNKTWFELAEEDKEDDIRFFVIHELRHVYQHMQIEKLKAGEQVTEDIDVIKRWDDEFEHYILNRGDPESRKANLMQEVEMDANGYAMAVLRSLHYTEQYYSPIVRMEEDQTDFSNTRAVEYLKSKPELKRYCDRKYREETGRLPVAKKPERNDKCPCGSGNKFKKCCIGKGIYD